MAAAPAMSLQTFLPIGGTQGLKSVLSPSSLSSIDFCWLSALHNRQRRPADIATTFGEIARAAVHLSDATSSAEAPLWLRHFSGRCHSPFTFTNKENKKGNSLVESATTASEAKDTSEFLKDEPQECHLPSSTKTKNMDNSDNNFMTKGWKNLKEAIYGKSDIQVTMSSILKHMLWSEEKDCSSFQLTMRLFQDCVTSHNTQTRKLLLIKSLLGFMDDREFQVDQLLLSFFILLSKPSYNFTLHQFISKCMLNSDACSFGPKLKGMQIDFTPSRFKPCCTSSGFISDEIAKCHSSLRITNNCTLTSIFWVLHYHCAKEHQSNFPKLTVAQGKYIGSLTVSERKILEALMDDTILHSTFLSLQPSFEFCKIFSELSKSEADTKMESTNEVFV
jgi:hypothetical protein